MMNLKIKILAWFLKGTWKGNTWRRKIVIKKIAQEMLEAMEVHSMKSWKTTVFGLIGAIGAYLVSIKDPAWLGTVGQILSALGVAGLGMMARDNDKSSEDVGAKFGAK